MVFNVGATLAVALYTSGKNIKITVSSRAAARVDLRGEQQL